MIRATLPLLGALAVAMAACAEPPEPRTEAVPPGPAGDTSAASPMTVNPAPQGTPATPPTLPEDPAADTAMPPGPVNPGA